MVLPRLHPPHATRISPSAGHAIKQQVSVRARPVGEGSERTVREAMPSVGACVNAQWLGIHEGRAYA